MLAAESETSTNGVEEKSSRTRRTGKRHGRTNRRKSNGKRGRRPAAPFPPVSFVSVLPLADAIQKYGAGQPTRRLTIFDKLDKSPESSSSRLLITNSTRYGVTKGHYQSEVLELTPLGAVATSPDSTPRDKLAARFKLAIESIEPFKFLYEKNVDKRVASPEILQDSLADQKVAPEQRKECVEIFLQNLKDLGLLRTVAGAERIISVEQLLEETPAAGRRTPISTVGGEATIHVDKSKKSWNTTCFIIAPIGAEASEHRKHSDMVLEALIRRALDREWEVVRADQITAPGMISGQVVEHLLNSGLVIADLSFHNPNVFYELALRHAIGKPTVHVIRKGDAIPFDLKDFRTITIDTEDKYDLVAKLDIYRAEIGNYVREAVAEGAESNNPFRTFARGYKLISDK